VIAYRERDSMNVFDSGGAAFDRIWLVTPITKTGQARRIGWRSTLSLVKTGFASMPGGPGGAAGTLGGDGFAVSRYSAHRQEAITLVRFLLRAQIQASEKESDSGGPPAQPEFYDPLSISNSNVDVIESNQRASGIVTRPSVEAGNTYEQVTRAYFAAVHSVLTGQKDAREAAAELEKHLIEITSFSTGPPRRAP